MLRFPCAAFLLLAATAPATAQLAASPEQLAANPVVTVQISEQLRSPPDQATLSISTESRAATASASLSANKLKTQSLLGAIQRAGIADRDVQTQGVSLSADYRYDTVNGVGTQRFAGYIARNTVSIKTRALDRLTGLLDSLTAAGATGIYGPNFDIADPLPIRRQARVQAMARGEAEATEYARNAGFARVRLLTVQEGVSNRSYDIVVTGSRIGAPPPPPPPAPERGGDTIAPGQIETGVVLTLQYRMER